MGQIEKQKVLVSMSGGMDSAVLAAYYLDEGFDVIACHFRYPSKHNRWEANALTSLLRFYNLKHVTFDMTPVFEGFRSNLLQSGGEIPEGHYAAPSMTQTVVPGRNMIFASIMAGYAESHDISKIALGVHAGDHHIYPDCRPKFIEFLRLTILESSEGDVEVEAPFLHSTKAHIVAIGTALDVPFRLTRTCYKDQPLACGCCGSCTERLEAFEMNSKTDPAIYDDDFSHNKPEE